MRSLTTANSIPIHERVELPESWIPADSRVEIDAKITAGRTDDPISPTRYKSLTHGTFLSTRLLHDWPPNDGGRTGSRPGTHMGRVSNAGSERMNKSNADVTSVSTINRAPRGKTRARHLANSGRGVTPKTTWFHRRMDKAAL